MKSILELLQRLWLYKTFANKPPILIPFVLYEESIAQGMIIMCCFYDTNIAGLEVDVALKMDLRTVGVDECFVPATG